MRVPEKPELTVDGKCVPHSDEVDVTVGKELSPAEGPVEERPDQAPGKPIVDLPKKQRRQF